MKRKMLNDLKDNIKQTQQQTNNVVNVTTGLVVNGGRIARYWQNKDIFITKYTHKKDIHNNNLHAYTDAASFVEHFNLHSVEFGNWLNQSLRVQFLYAAADCLHQLAELFNVPDNQIGLNKKLSISLGARGFSKAAAHYEPYKYAIINITKTHVTNGSFAHEFGHAIDNLLSVFKNDRKNGNNQYVSGGMDSSFVINKGKISGNDGIFEFYAEQIFKILYYDNKLNLSKYATYLDSISITTDYYKRRTEVFARTFETWLGYRLGKNYYNDMFYKKNYQKLDKMYPNVEILEKIDNVIFKLFHDGIRFINSVNSENEITEPKVEQPKVEQPKVEQPKVEQPKVEQPKVEQPKVEQPKVEPNISNVKNKKIIYGDETNIVTPSEILKSRYAIVELNYIIASNLYINYAINPNYPQTCQTRSYKEDDSEQTKVESYSRNFDFKHLLNTSPDATTGGPIITKEGIVLGGNGRAMILQRVEHFYNKKYIEYVNELKKISNIMFGIEKNVIDIFLKPVLVRIVNIDIKQCSKISNILNKSNANEYDEIREGIALARQIEEMPNALITIAKFFENSEADTFKQLLNDKYVSKSLISFLHKLGIINNTNTNSLIISSNEFTKKGENLVETLLLASILPDKKLISSAKIFTLKILKSLPALIRIKALNENYNIISEIQNAIIMESKRRDNGLTLEMFIKQKSAFDEDYSPLEIVIYKIMQKSGINKFTNFINYYVDRAEESQVGIDIFGTKLNKLDIINNYLGNNSGLNSNLSGIIDDFNRYKNLVNDYANTLYEIPVFVGFNKGYANVYHLDKIISRIQLDNFNVVINEDDLYKRTNYNNSYNHLANILAKYLKKLKRNFKNNVDKTTINKQKEVLFDNTEDEKNNFDNNNTFDFNEITNIATFEDVLNAAKRCSDVAEGHKFIELLKFELKKSNYSNIFISSSNFFIKLKDKVIDIKEIIPPYYYQKSDNYKLFDKSNANEYDEMNFNCFEEQDEFNIETNLNDIIEYKTENLLLVNKTKTLLGKLSKPFRMLIWGKQGQGKSTLLLQLLNDISLNGKCLLILNEEKISTGRVSERIKKLGLSNLNNIDITDSNDYNSIINKLNSNKYFCVAIDSKDNFEPNENKILDFWENYPQISFMLVSHSYKNGEYYTGNRKFAYLCDTEIHVDKSIAMLLKHRDNKIGNSIPVFDKIKNTVKKNYNEVNIFRIK